MIDLSTTFLGLKVRTPLVPSASPLSQELDSIRRMEDAGASAVVLSSLFEEQLRQESGELHHRPSQRVERFAEALSYPHEPTEFRVGPEGYLNHIRKAKQAVGIPVIASLNGATVGGWTDHAKQVEQAGADAIECNIYAIPTNPDTSSAEIEQDYIQIVSAVKSAVKIPVAIKLSPFFTNMANMAKRLDEAKADALVLFNRFYQPDIDLDQLEIHPNVLLSTPQALRLPLTWIGILYGRIRASLAATSGVHGPEDVIKLLMVGADVTMLCSTLMRNGISHLRYIEEGLVGWMDRNEYDSVQQIKGSMSQLRCPDPSVFERAQYMKAIKGVQHVVVTSKEAWRLLTGD